MELPNLVRAIPRAVRHPDTPLLIVIRWLIAVSESGCGVFRQSGTAEGGRKRWFLRLLPPPCPPGCAGYPSVTSALIMSITSSSAVKTLPLVSGPR